MKGLLLAVALIMGTATFASAGSSSQISMQVGNAPVSMEMEFYIEPLTAEQVSALYLTISSSENASDCRTKVRAVLNDNNVVMTDVGDPEVEVKFMTPRSQLISIVRSKETELGIENVSLRSLTNAQLTELYLLANGSDSGSEKMTKAEGIVLQ